MAFAVEGRCSQYAADLLRQGRIAPGGFVDGMRAPADEVLARADWFAGAEKGPRV